MSLNELIELYKELEEAYKTLKGNIVFSDLDGSLQYTLKFTSLGQINCEGSFQEHLSQENNRLKFEFVIDQSHLPAALTGLKAIVEPFYMQQKSKE